MECPEREHLVVDELLDAGDFDWHKVSVDKAREGVRDGTYDFALAIPSGFSESLTGAARSQPEQARLVMTTNDANSYLSTTIADTVVSKVRAAIESETFDAVIVNFANPDMVGHTGSLTAAIAAFIDTGRELKVIQ